MADTEGLKVAKDYHVDTPFANQEGFYVKGANSLDWGMKKHLSNIFDPKSGNTVMFAFDHGYFMGSTAGLERLDLLLPKLAPYVDVFMGTRGAIRACVPPEITKGIALRVSSGSSMLNDDLSHEVVAVDIEDAIRMNADCMAVQTFIGADGQLASIDNLSRTINAGFRYSIPTLGVVAVGKQMERTDRFFKLATRIVAEMGVQLVKTYNCENFEEIVAACPVPIVIAGGYDKHLPFDSLGEEFCDRAKAVILTGDTAEKIAAAIETALEHRGQEKLLPVYQVSDLQEAVHTASSLAEDGDIVVLSPACASFDRFRNFEERGNLFRRYVMELEA